MPIEPRAQQQSTLPLRLSNKRLPVNRRSLNARPLTQHPAVRLIQSSVLEPRRLDGSSRQVLRDGGIGTPVLPVMRCSHPRGGLAGWGWGCVIVRNARDDRLEESNSFPVVDVIIEHVGLQVVA